MKRSEAIERVALALAKDFEGDATSEPTESQMFMFRGLAKAVLREVEQMGMLPPLNAVKTVPNPLRPGTLMHTSTERVWDEEEEDRKSTRLNSSHT